MPVSFSGTAPTVLTIKPINTANTEYFPVRFGLVENAKYGPIGQGGWQIVDRPKMVAATQWFDRSPYSLDFQGVLDNSITLPGGIMSSVEDDCVQIESWADKIDNELQPPILSISGPVPGQQRLWVMHRFDFLDAIRDPQAGFRIQQIVNLTLYEYSPATGNALSEYSFSPAQTAANAVNNTTYTGTQQFLLYTIKDGDTLDSICSAWYGKSTDSLKYDIKTFNGIRDEASMLLMSGQVIKLPRE